MSIKSTIKHGEDYHLYTNAMDYENIYLDISRDYLLGMTSQFITIQIPAEIWENMKNSYKFDTSKVDLTDKQIEELVIKEVDERIKLYNEKPDCVFRTLAGSLNYGLPSESKEKQIENGIKFWKEVRLEQQQLKKRINQK
jgi:hypothetical protein